jgi:hypothetical protein
LHRPGVGCGPVPPQPTGSSNNDVMLGGLGVRDTKGSRRGANSLCNIGISWLSNLLSQNSFEEAWRAHHAVESTGVERVSVRGDKICRERVCASQRRGGILPPQSAVTRSRDWKGRSGLRECRGKPGVFRETAGNRICAGLRGGGCSSNRTGLRGNSRLNAKNREFLVKIPVSD